MKQQLGRLADRARLMASVAGLDTTRTAATARGVSAYRSNRRAFLAQAHRSGGEFVLGDSWPCPSDRYLPGGVASGQYFHQDLYVAQLVHLASPRRHIDVGSRVDGFVAHVASFRQVEVIDIRPLETTARNIVFRLADLTRLPADYEGCCDSLSCLHALEHVGLGRYGDDIDYYGYRKGWDALHRMLEPSGRLYFSVPVGLPQRVEFDAHRIFSTAYLTAEMFADRYEVERAAFIDDAGDLHADVSLDQEAIESSFGCSHGCGVFVLRKI